LRERLLAGREAPRRRPPDRRRVDAGRHRRRRRRALGLPLRGGPLLGGRRGRVRPRAGARGRLPPRSGRRGRPPRPGGGGRRPRLRGERARRGEGLPPVTRRHRPDRRRSRDPAAAAAPGSVRRAGGARPPARGRRSEGSTIDGAMSRRALPRAAVAAAVVVAAGALLASAGARTGAQPNVGWGGFGNTPDELRHSPLTEITTKNVSRLARVYTVDFHAIDAGTRRGEQSFPVEANGVLYVTTNDDNVWAVDAVTGKVKWRWTPGNVAVFKTFGIVANRGVALCDGHGFVLTLDMSIVSLDAATGKLERQVPIARAVPGASSNYGYSETSAPICANHRLILGAAGSEYGVRGFVMAYRTDLSPAWPNPFWTIPPAGTQWRRYGTLVGGGVVWTPVTVDTTTNTLYFGTGSATPLYFPQIRPGSNPRADSLVAVNLATGRMKWWQQQMAHNEWSYDTAQPPLVYTARVGGKKQRIVSVATMEGVWFAYDAATGRPIYQRVKVIDRTEHPTLKAGKPVAVFPSSLGGINYSPASFDQKTNYVLNAAAETAAIDVQAALTPTQKKRKFNLGDVFLGLQNGNFGSLLPGW